LPEGEETRGVAGVQKGVRLAIIGGLTQHTFETLRTQVHSAIEPADDDDDDDGGDGGRMPAGLVPPVQEGPRLTYAAPRVLESRTTAASGRNKRTATETPVGSDSRRQRQFSSASSSSSSFSSSSARSSMAGSSQGSLGSQAAMEVDVEDELNEDETEEDDDMIHREVERRAYATLSSMQNTETDSARRARLAAIDDLDSDNDAFDNLTNHQRKSLGTSKLTPVFTNILYNMYIYIR
jgi:hypothetical protein